MAGSGMEVDPPTTSSVATPELGTLKRSNSAPMINILVNSGPNSPNFSGSPCSSTSSGSPAASGSGTNSAHSSSSVSSG